jgi:adenylate kinase family enzyme
MESFIPINYNLDMNEITLKDLKQFKRIYIVGAVGSGKTTLARKLSYILDLPHTEVDVMRWDDSGNKRVHRRDSERTKYLNRIINSNKWIVDGAQTAEWTEPLWQACDIVIITTPSLLKRLFWTIKRYLLNMEEKQKGAPLRYLWKNLVWTTQFGKIYKKRYTSLSDKYGKPIFVLKSRGGNMAV